MGAVIRTSAGAGALDPRRIAEQCRATGLGIVNNARRWGKAELAGWLAGPYRRVTRYAAVDDATGPQEASLLPPVIRPEAAEIDDGRVEALLAQLHEEITELFQGATLGKIDAFSRACLKHGFIARATLPDGRLAHLPVDLPRMHLLERVASLFAADARTSLASYATVRICPHCGAMTFGACTHTPSGWQTKRVPRLPREE